MADATTRIRIKRAYEPPARGDGVRVLVDRLWPRGLRKDDAQFDQWRKDISPSTALRKFYAHQPERFAEFKKRYRAELRRKEAVAAIAEIVELSGRRPVTLITASRDLEHSEAAVLANHLRASAKRAVARRGSASCTYSCDVLSARTRQSSSARARCRI
jgi:uncharacterized protein YeaO (DUF488 family)